MEVVNHGVRYEIVRDETAKSQEDDEESNTEEEVNAGVSKGRKETYIFFA